MAAFESAHAGARRIQIVSGKTYGSPNLATNADGAGSAAAAQRRKRIAKYKVYTVEGKVKDSLRKGLRWIKNKCSRIVHGFSSQTNQRWSPRLNKSSKYEVCLTIS